MSFDMNCASFHQLILIKAVSFVLNFESLTDSEAAGVDVLACCYTLCRKPEKNLHLLRCFLAGESVPLS